MEIVVYACLEEAPEMGYRRARISLSVTAHAVIVRGFRLLGEVHHLCDHGSLVIEEDKARNVNVLFTPCKWPTFPWCL